MENKESQKLLVWTGKDRFLIIFTYVINVVVLSLLFLFMIYLEGYKGEKSLGEYLKGTNDFYGFLVLLVITIAAMAFYFNFENKDFLHDASNSEMLFLIMELSLIVCFCIGKYVNHYVRPFAIVGMLTLFLTNSKIAVFMSFVFSSVVFLFDVFSGLFDGFSANIEIYFFITSVVSGVLAVYCMKGVYSRIKLIFLSFAVSMPSLLCICLPVADFGGNDYLTTVISGAVSGPCAVVLFMVILPVFEGLFKKVSCFKLAELTDHKARFIRKMIAEAPGTFNHAIVVSNIAEACATAIGEDALLARTCAYYHDMGKLRRPEFFSENQSDGSNPHDDLTPELSANIIKSHATDGYSLAVKNRFPKEIANVCREHHGTMPMLFFYDKAKKFTDGEVPYNTYCYAGPKPQSKISAIIMIADGCEAAVRSITDRSREGVTSVVKKIVSDRMQLGQFDECEITLKELNIIIHTIVNTLSGVYHERIEYPKVSLEGIVAEQKEEEK